MELDTSCTGKRNKGFVFYHACESNLHTWQRFMMSLNPYVIVTFDLRDLMGKIIIQFDFSWGERYTHQWFSKESNPVTVCAERERQLRLIFSKIRSFWKRKDLFIWPVIFHILGPEGHNTAAFCKTMFWWFVKCFTLWNLTHYKVTIWKIVGWLSAILITHNVYSDLVNCPLKTAEKSFPRAEEMVLSC